MAGKAVPGILVAVGQGTIVALAARFLYQVPFGGSTTLLMAGMVCYGLALAGIGLFVSSLCSTQQQAFLGVFSFMVPAVILSGLCLPHREHAAAVPVAGGRGSPSATSSCCSRGSSSRISAGRRPGPCSGPCSPSPVSPSPWRWPCSAAISPDDPAPARGRPLAPMPALNRGRAGHGNRQLVYPFMHRFEFPRITPEEIYK